MLNPKRFQTFEEAGGPAHGAARLAALRAQLALRGLDGFVVPRADEHQGEYVPPAAERLAWLTGFSGSAGLAVAFRDRAAVFVDGRYTLQVRDQVDLTQFVPVHMHETPAPDWLRANVRKGEKIGYDPRLHTPAQLDQLRPAVEAAGGSLVPCTDNPLDAAWTDRPAPPLAPFSIQDIAHAGESSESKRQRLGKDLAKANADAAVLTLPESIAWLLNIRGGDVPHTPMPLSFALLHAGGRVDLFADERKLTPPLRAHLGNAATVRGPDAFGPALEQLKDKRVAADPAWSSAWVFDRLAQGGATVVRMSDPCLLPKACKNAAELAGARAAHVRDGAAVSRFLRWIAAEAPRGGVDEVAACERLEDFRRETGALKELSFDSIAGAGPDGAIVHYRPSHKTSRKLAAGELFLIDSGGQYADGTTDITRTVAIGGPTEEMRDRFTRVLKGHIALARAVFPEGTTGAQLDTLARLPLWQAGLDYDHGTGHGVGSYLSVHEGPQNISKRPVAQALLPGMICSNEPGYYKTGAYGIRIENLIVVTPVEVAGAERKMLGFETLTLAPIDRALVAPGLLTAEERDWLNAYHARVCETLAPLLDAETRDWLAAATAAL